MFHLPRILKTIHVECMQPVKIYLIKSRMKWNKKLPKFGGTTNVHLCRNLWFDSENNKWRPAGIFCKFGYLNLLTVNVSAIVKCNKKMRQSTTLLDKFIFKTSSKFCCSFIYFFLCLFSLTPSKQFSKLMRISILNHILYFQFSAPMFLKSVRSHIFK